MSDNLDDIPLPEPCTIEDKLVSTRKDLVEESDGSLFNRKCDNLDTTIPKRKDRFIECEELPEVPKVLLKNKQFNEVEFPGVPLAEIPKKLLAHLLPCCLEGRSAGFDFEIVQELNSQNKKPNIEDITQASTHQPGISQTPTVFPLSIQLGTSGYLLIGLSLKPELCFCDENCGDEDYIHIKVNLDAEYHDDDDDDVIQDPDLTITDEQLTKLISSHGGGGGGNPLCSRKMFAQYDDGWFSPMLGIVANGPEFSLDESSFLQYGNNADVVIAPYLHNLTLTNGGIYKLEYFCEYSIWVVTDGECQEQVGSYTPKHHETVNSSGGLLGEFDLSEILNAGDTFTIRSSVGAGSSLTAIEAFDTSPAFSMDEYAYLMYTAEVKSGVTGVIIYNIIITSTESNKVYACKIVFHIDTPVAEEDENAEEET